MDKEMMLICNMKKTASVALTNRFQMEYLAIGFTQPPYQHKEQIKALIYEYRQPKNTNWELYKENLSRGLRNSMSSVMAIDYIELTNRTITNANHEAEAYYDSSKTASKQLKRALVEFQPKQVKERNQKLM